MAGWSGKGPMAGWSGEGAVLPTSSEVSVCEMGQCGGHMGQSACRGGRGHFGWCWTSWRHHPQCKSVTDRGVCACVCDPIARQLLYPAACTLRYPTACTLLYPAACALLYPDACTLLYPAACTLMYPAVPCCLHPVLPCRRGTSWSARCHQSGPPGPSKHSWCVGAGGPVGGGTCVQDAACTLSWHRGLNGLNGWGGGEARFTGDVVFRTSPHPPTHTWW